MSSPVAMPLTAFVRGIDVSHLQGKVNWQAVAQAGVSFALAKATEGITFVDSQFSVNWIGMKSAGVLRGAYHFLHPARPVDGQVENFVRTVSQIAAGDLPPVLDLEEVPGPTGDEWENVPSEERVPLILKWLEAVENRLGAKPIIYTRSGFLDLKLPNPAPLAQYLLWIAHYTDQPAPAVPAIWSKWTFWQYSDAGRVDGIASQVDLNWFNGSLPELMALAKGGPSTGA